MSLEQAITENTAAIRELVALIKAQTGGAVLPVRQAEVKETKEPAKTPKADAAPSSEPTQTASDSSANSSTESSETDKPEGVEYKQIQQLVPQIAKTPEGTEKVVALFGRYGVKRGPELKPEQYDRFYADLLKVQEGELDPRTAEV